MDKTKKPALRMEEVIRNHERRLLATPGVVGIGEGEYVGAPVVLIMVRELTPQLKQQLPRQLDGYPVRVETVGEITAF